MNTSVETYGLPVESILILVVKRVGEILLTTPAIRAFRRAFPEATIDVAVDAPMKALLEDNPAINHLILLDPSRATDTLAWARRIRKRRYDLTVDFLANPRSAFLSLASGARLRIGLDKRVRRRAYHWYVGPSPAASSYVPDVRLNAVRMLGFEPDGVAMDFFPGEEGRQAGEQRLTEAGIKNSDRFAAMAPLSMVPHKLWPLENFARVADTLIRDHHLPVVLLGGPNEYHFLEETWARMQERPAALLEFRDLNSMGYVLSRACCYIGNDSGVRHLASAVRIPTVTVFGPTNPREWNELEDPRHPALWKEVSCRAAKCYVDCPFEYHCLDLVTPAEVLEAVEPLLPEVTADDQ